MINKKLLSFLSLFLILTISLGVVFAENTTDKNTDIQTFDDLQSQINSVSENDTLKISGTYKSLGEDITINKTLTIEGSPGATLDADEYSGVFMVSHFNNLTLKNLKFINGNGDAQGGAIYSRASLILVNCTFINNRANPVESTNPYGEQFNMSTGGAISCLNSVQAINCKFINNTANTCGAIYYEGSLTCTGCEFSYNKVNNALGIIYTNLNSKCVLNNCSIHDNCANDGIIYVDGKLTVTNSTFKNNNPATFIITTSSANINNKKYSAPAVLNDTLKTTYILKATTSKLTTTYNSGETLKISANYIASNEGIEDYYLKVKVYTGSKSKIYEVVTNSKGIGTFKASKLSAGTHKIEISSYTDINDFAIKKITTTVKISKAKTTIKAPSVKNKYKKSKYFKVTVKSNKKAVAKTYIKIKIDSKTYKIKTDSKGIVKFNTKNLKKGKHKVKITSGNSNYKMSKKSTIIIY